jgi:hypothetical protein
MRALLFLALFFVCGTSEAKVLEHEEGIEAKVWEYEEDGVRIVRTDRPCKLPIVAHVLGLNAPNPRTAHIYTADVERRACWVLLPISGVIFVMDEDNNMGAVPQLLFTFQPGK